ncbi:MAG TPA: redoxin domain-containing protein, partial [Comamonas sp.]
MARQIGILLERISPVGAMMNDSGPKLGEQAPKMVIPSLTGSAMTLGGPSLKSTLVFFLSPTCPVCKKLIPVLKEMQISEGNWLQIYLASDGQEAKHRKFIEEQGLQDMPYLLSEQLGMTYKVARLPFAVLMDEEGTVKSKGLVNSREQIESIFNAHESGYSSI